MARGRMISRAISLDEKVNALPGDTARLLFTWIIPHLDCEGRLHGDATTIKSIVFPRRNISVRKIEKYLKIMEDLKLILRFSVNGNVYLLAPSFEKHQTGLVKEKEAQSQIPPPPPELLQSYSKPRSDKVFCKVKTKFKSNNNISSKNRDNNKNFPITSEEMAEIVLLYEGEIGKITEMVAQALNDAIQRYSADQIKDAIKEAVLRGKRNWKYIEGILKNREADGHDGNRQQGPSPLEKYGGRNAVISAMYRAKVKQGEGGSIDEFRGKSDDDLLTRAKELGVAK